MESPTKESPSEPKTYLYTWEEMGHKVKETTIRISFSLFSTLVLLRYLTASFSRPRTANLMLVWTSFTCATWTRLAIIATPIKALTTMGLISKMIPGNARCFKEILMNDIETWLPENWEDCQLSSAILDLKFDHLRTRIKNGWKAVWAKTSSVSKHATKTGMTLWTRCVRR